MTDTCYKCGRGIIYHPIHGMFKCAGCNMLVKFCKCQRQERGELKILAQCVETVHIVVVE